MDPIEALLERQGVQTGVAGIIDQVRRMFATHEPIKPGVLDERILAHRGPRAPTPSELQAANQMRGSVFAEQWAAEDPRNANAMSALAGMEQTQGMADPGNWLGAGVIQKAGRAAREGVSVLDRMAKPTLRPEGELVGGGVQTRGGLLPKDLQEAIAKDYPPVGPPVLKTDPKSGKEYLAKQLTPEAEKVAEARKAVQSAIDRGEYAPYYDVAARSNVPPGAYDFPSTTVTDALPKKEATIAKYREMADTPETRGRLKEAFARGSEDAGAENWYAMRQLYDDFVKELGPEEGAKMFKERFADAMAATTGGADPTSNLLMAHYANVQRARGVPLPETHQLPFPIGGRYASGNLEMYDKVINRGRGLGLEAPKRYNFSANFRGGGGATIDEQMMGAFDATGKLKAPPGESYGAYEGVVHQLAREQGLAAPMNFQDVAWAGLKSLKEEAAAKGKGKAYKREAAIPMIEHVNQAIERTSKLTGLPPEEVVKRGLIRSEIPLYGVGAGAIGLPMLRDVYSDEGA